MIDRDRLKEEGFIISDQYIADVDEEGEQYFEAEIRRMFFNPGVKVRLHQDQIKALRTKYALANDPDSERDNTLASFAAAGERSFEVERVHLINPMAVTYKLKDVDVLIDARLVTDARATKHICGLVLVHDDRVFAVELDFTDYDNPVAVEAYEIRGGLEKGFGDDFNGSKTLDEFKAALAIPDEAQVQQGREHFDAVSGEFIIADTGDEIWALSYRVWSSGVSAREMAVAVECVEALMGSAPKLN
jgi:hypothetical protein